MAKQVTLTLKSLTAIVAEMDEIKSKVSAHAGTAAAKLAAAKAEAIGSGAVKVPTLQVKASDSIETAEALVAEWQSSLAHRIDEATTAILRKAKDDTETGLTALRETFKAKSEAATALKSVLVAMSVAGAEGVEIPTLKGTGRIGTGSGGSAKVSGQAFYVERNGERKYMAPSQNKFSSLAWYHGAEIGAEADVNKTKDGFKGCGAKALESFLKGKGVDVTSGTPWSFKASDTFSVGMDVIAEEAKADG